MKPSIILIGLGNPLMTDEGIGVAVVQEFVKRKVLPAYIEIMDLGTGGLTVLHAIKDRDKAVFVDCCFMDEPPGTIRRFTPDDVKSRKFQARQSLHEGDLLETLALAERLGQCPNDVVIFGIQPQTVEPGEALSDSLQAHFQSCLETVRAEFAEG